MDFSFDSDGRQAERHAVDLDGTLRGADLQPVDVQLEDLSANGCRLTGAADLRIGDLVTVGVAGAGMRSARVVRQAGGHFGCEFVDPLSSVELIEALAYPAFVVARITTAPMAIPPETRATPAPLVRAKPPKFLMFFGIAVLSMALWVAAVVLGRTLVHAL